MTPAFQMVDSCLDGRSAVIRSFSQGLSLGRFFPSGTPLRPKEVPLG